MSAPSAGTDADISGPGEFVHVLFNTEVNSQGQTIVIQAKAHADIGNPQSGLLGLILHGAADVAIARIGSSLGHGCAVKIF